MRRLLNPWWFLSLIGVIAAAWVCWRLADWQWQRARSDSGSAQNYLYAIQWLVFMGMGFYGWGRACLDVAHSGDESPSQRRKSHLEGLTYVENPMIDDSDDPELAAYNAMLARMNRSSK